MSPIVKRRVWLGFLLFIIFAGLLRWKVSEDRQPRFTFSNGEQLTFLGVSAGSNATHCYGNVFQQIVHKVPFGVGKKLAGDTVATAEDRGPFDLVFWFRFTGVDDPSRKLSFRIVDQDGFEADPGFDARSFWVDKDDGGLLAQGSAWPRKSRIFKLRILESPSRTGPRLLGEVAVRNPFWKRSPPTLTPQPLPVAGLVESNTVLLKELSVTLGCEWSAPGLAQAQHGNSVTLGFDLPGNEQSTNKWLFFGARLGTAMGDFTQAWQFFPVSEEEPLRLIGKWPFWPTDDAVKIETLWIRQEVPPPERVVVFLNVPIPSPLPPYYVLVSTNHPLGRFSITYNSPGSFPAHMAGLYLWSDDSRFYDYGGSNVNTYYFQAARDDKLKDLKQISGRQFELPAGTKSIHLMVHLPLARRVDFFASPRIVSTNLVHRPAR